MTPSTLRAAGEALYGDRWQSAIAADLGLADRTIRRWLAGDRDMPDDLAPRIMALIEARLPALKSAYTALAGDGSNTTAKP